MQQLTDSTGLVQDGAALRARMSADGYVFMRGLLPREEVLNVRADVYAALRDSGWLAPGATVEAPYASELAVRENYPGYFEPYTLIQRSQRFHELAHQPALVRLLQDLLEDPVLVHPRKIARTSLPRDDEYTPPHQDYRLIQGTVDCLTAWVPLGDCPISLGGLRVIEGSHLAGLIPGDAARGPGGLKVEVPDDDPGWRSIDYEAGDVLVFTSLTVHGALPNDEDCLRFSADYRYQSVREPLLEASIGPHYAPTVPDWPELTAGWTSRRSVEAPDGLVFVDVIPPLDPELRIGPSRFLPTSATAEASYHP